MELLQILRNPQLLQLVRKLRHPMHRAHVEV